MRSRGETVMSATTETINGPTDTHRSRGCSMTMPLVVFSFYMKAPKLVSTSFEELV